MKLEILTNNVLRKTEYAPSEKEFYEILERAQKVIDLDFEPVTVGEASEGFTIYGNTRNSKFLKDLKTLEPGEGFGLKFSTPEDVKIKIYYIGNPRQIEIGKNIMFTGIYDDSLDTTVYYSADNRKIRKEELMLVIASEPFIGATVNSSGDVLSTSYYNQVPTFM